MGNSAKMPITAVVQIDPIQYYNCPYVSKPKTAEAVGRINRYYREKGANLLLGAPGRLGTSSPELGVPVSFANISGFRGICEVSDKRAGYMPELSYGSHMFQDLQNIFPDICPDMKDLFPMFHVSETPGLYYWNDALSAETLCG